MEEKREIDWESLSLDYRAGLMSLRELAAKYGITHGAVNKRAKRDGWVRDLSPLVQARARELVSKAVVSSLVSDPVSGEVYREPTVEEEAKVMSEAQVVAEVVLSERKDIRKSRELGVKLFAELEEATDKRELFNQLGELMHAPDEKGKDKLNEIYMKVISMPGRVSAYKQLTDAIKTMVGLERQSYGLADNANGESDRPVEKTQMTPQEEARRIAFILASAMHNKMEV